LENRVNAAFPEGGKEMNRRISFLRFVGAIALTAAPAQVFGVVGRYLPDLPVDWGDTKTTAYGPVRMFDQPVTDTVKHIDAGQIKFDYAKTFEEQNPPGTTKYGGAVLKGGFFANNGVTVKPGFSLAWVQTVISTNTGGDAQTNWGLPATGAGEYPDAPPADPRYGGNNPGGASPPAGVTIGFEDFPRRTFTANPENWLAELGLTCISNTADVNGFREVRVISSLLWGFSLNPNGPLDINDVGENAPHAWGPATNSYLNTLNGFYDGMGPAPGNKVSSKYLFSNNTNCFIPEPTMIWLLVIGAVWCGRRRAA
jgi:hypothetical protein